MGRRGAAASPPHPASPWQRVTGAVFGITRPAAMDSPSTEVLKWLAIVAMVLDHVGDLLLGTHDGPLRLAGRLAFPVFALLLAHNLAFRTRSPGRYLLRLVIFAALSQPIYYWVWPEKGLNIFFTLAAGLAILAAASGPQDRRSPLDRAPIVIGVTAVVLLATPWLEYGLFGVAAIVALGAWMRTGGWTLLGLACVGFALAQVLSSHALVAAAALPVALVVAALPAGLPRGPRYFFYAFYPGHLLVLLAVKAMTGF